MFNFSVIIPCYHDEDKLAYLLHQLHQLPHVPEEIIVVDGESQDNTQNKAQEAGAIGAIICNHTAGDGVINMAAGGDFEALDTIPSVMLSFED
mgnify:CR=1 FL=1